MKKFIVSICILLVLAVLFFRSSNKDSEIIAPCSTTENTTETEYLDVKKLYFYESLYELLEGNQEPEDMGIFNTYSELNIELFDYGYPSVKHAHSALTTFSYQSMGYPFAEICMKMNANPFSNFNLLVDKGWVLPDEYIELKDKFDGVAFNISGYSPNDCGIYMEDDSESFSLKKTFLYNKHGCEEFLKTVISLERSNLYTPTFVALPEPHELYDIYVNYSEKDDCYYSFFINNSRSEAYITAVYFRSSDKKHITDVTAQLLCISFPVGDGSAGTGTSMSLFNSRENIGKIGLFTALEQTLTGNNIFSIKNAVKYYDNQEYCVIPEKYEGENYTATLNAKKYRTGLEASPPVLDSPYDYFDIYTFTVKMK